jgi:hypothetical protein
VERRDRLGHIARSPFAVALVYAVFVVYGIHASHVFVPALTGVFVGIIGLTRVIRARRRGWTFVRGHTASALGILVVGASMMGFGGALEHNCAAVGPNGPGAAADEFVRRLMMSGPRSAAKLDLAPAGLLPRPSPGQDVRRVLASRTRVSGGCLTFPGRADPCFDYALHVDEPTDDGTFFVGLGCYSNDWKVKASLARSGAIPDR